MAENTRDSSKRTEIAGRLGIIEGTTEETFTGSMTEIMMDEQRSPLHIGKSIGPASYDTYEMTGIIPNFFKLGSARKIARREADYDMY